MASVPQIDLDNLTTSPTADEALEGWYKRNPPITDGDPNPWDVSRAELYSKDLWRKPFAEMRAQAPILSLIHI